MPQGNITILVSDYTLEFVNITSFGEANEENNVEMTFSF